MVKSKVETVIVAIRPLSSAGLVVGSTKTVVLEKIGVSVRKLELAVKRGAVGLEGGVMVSNDKGECWTVMEVEFLRVRR